MAWPRRRGRPTAARRFGGRHALIGFVAAVAAAIIGALVDHLAPAEVVGQPRVVDGDTLEFGDRRVRLAGIDAPELHQTCLRDGRAHACGREVAERLRALIVDREVQCKGHERDRHGRLVAACVAGTTDINAWLVREGFARAELQHSLAYAALERDARAARKGLWAGEWEPPWEWRERNPRE